MRPFVVDVYHVSPKLEISKKRHEADTVEEAERMMETYKAMGDVNRVVVGRRVPGSRSIDVKKAWNRPIS